MSIPSTVRPHSEPGAHAASMGERDFALDEMFFSVTDEKGIIKSGNEVFIRVSGYERGQMVGRPHNIVRHPDMPRAVFKLLWDEIGAGRPLAAYVKNRTIDGRHYWVMATALPTIEGYLSIRIKPTTQYFAIAQDLYTELREIERGIEGPDGLNRKEAMAVSGERLLAALRDAGFATYEAFMHAALLAEVRAREEYLVEMRRGPLRVHAGATAAQNGTLQQMAEMNSFLSQLVLRLDEYLNLNVHLAEKATYVRGLAGEVQLFALNATVAASKAEGHDGAAIGAVAGLLRSQSDGCNAMFEALGEAIASAAETLGHMLFPVAAARLQGEMLHSYMAETLDQGGCASGCGDLMALHYCLARGIETLTGLMTELDGRLRALQPNVQNLRGALKTMAALSLNGRIESARILDSGQFMTLFTTVGDQINDAWAELDELARSSGGAFSLDGRAVARLTDAVAQAEAAILSYGQEPLRAAG